MYLLQRVLGEEGVEDEGTKSQIGEEVAKTSTMCALPLPAHPSPARRVSGVSGPAIALAEAWRDLAMCCRTWA
jgi:hypothetical protein